MDAPFTAWNLNNESDGWRGFQEEWRRLIVRVAIANRILQRPEVLGVAEQAIYLQRLVRIASASASVGRAAYATYAAVGMRGGEALPCELDEGEVRLALFLLSRVTPFHRDIFAESMGASRELARSALDHFEEFGILTRKSRRRRGEYEISSSAMLYLALGGDGGR
jgi:hypothetical protein